MYAAVLKSISQPNADEEAELLERENDPRKAILLYLERRTDFIIKYHYVLEYLKTYSPLNMPPELEALFTHFREVELNRVTAILKKGKELGLLPTVDPKKNCRIILRLPGRFSLYRPEPK